MCFLRDAFYLVKIKVPKFSGTWLGSRFTTQVGCQHMKWRCGSSPRPSMRYKLTRHFVPALTACSLTDFNGTRAAAYQTCVFSSMRPRRCQPEFHSAVDLSVPKSISRSTQS